MSEELPLEVQDMLTHLTSVIGPIIRKQERVRIAVWLEAQQKVARYAKDGVHPEVGTRTQAAVLGWAVARILSNDLEESHGSASDQGPG